LLFCLNTTGLIFHVRKSDQLNGVHVQDLKMTGVYLNVLCIAAYLMFLQGGAVRFHRADLQQALMSHLKGQLHLSHRLQSYEEVDEQVHLHFQNGSTAICDVLIGMDGIKSVVRKRFLENQGLPKSPSYDPVWAGSIAYRGLIPVTELAAVFPNHRALSADMMVST